MKVVASLFSKEAPKLRSHMLSPHLGSPNDKSVIPRSHGIEMNDMLYMYVLYEICYMLNAI